MPRHESGATVRTDGDVRHGDPTVGVGKMIPAWLLPIAERCTEARELHAREPHLTGGGLGEMWREAFRAGVLALSDASPGKYLAGHRAIMAALPGKLRVLVTEAVSNHHAEVAKGLVAPLHRFGIGLDMDVDGISPGKREPMIGGVVDYAWTETTDAGTEGAVLMQELAGYGASETMWPGLDLLALGLAWAAHNDLERVKVGRTITSIGKPVRYQWLHLGDAQLQVVLARVRRTVLGAREARLGMHCLECPAKRQCAAWQLPVLTEAHAALKPVQYAGAGLTKLNLEYAHRTAYAMRQTADAVLFHVRAFREAHADLAANDNGSVTFANGVAMLEQDMVDAVRAWT